MKSVLISIQPKWCEPIASGIKTVEVRKTKPKIETPFKAYIYCTKGNQYLQSRNNSIFYLEDRDFIGGHGAGLYVRLNGMVIGEFVCNKIEDLRYDALEMTYFSRKYRDAKLLDEEFFPGTQVTYQEAYDYCKGMSYGEEDSDLFYGWHISDLKIYDKPRELSEFSKYGFEHPVPLKRPPQSWMYVEVEE